MKKKASERDMNTQKSMHKSVERRLQPHIQVGVDTLLGYPGKEPRTTLYLHEELNVTLLKFLMKYTVSLMEIYRKASRLL